MERGGKDGANEYDRKQEGKNRTCGKEDDIMVINGPLTMKRNIRNPIPAITRPGTVKDRPQLAWHLTIKFLLLPPALPEQKHLQ